MTHNYFAFCSQLKQPYSHRLLLLLVGMILFASHLAYKRNCNATTEKQPREKTSGAVTDNLLDATGDALPKGALLRLGTTRLRHHDTIMCLAVSPDGRWAASCGGGWHYAPAYPIRLWNLNTGKEHQQFIGHSAPAGTVVFSPDGTMLASVAGVSGSGRDDTVRLWDVATGKQLHVFRAHRNPVEDSPWGHYGLAFSRDGRILASAGQDRIVRLWDVATRNQISQFPEPTFATALSFSPDGKTLAVVGSVAIRLVDVKSGKTLQTLKGLRKGIFLVFFSSDGRQLISASGDARICWWNCTSGRKTRQIAGVILGNSEKGKWLAAMDGKSGQLWDIVEDRVVRRFPVAGRFVERPLNAYYSGAVVANGSRLISADGNRIVVLDTKTGKEIGPSNGHSSPVVGVGFLDDKRLVFSAGDTTIRLWSEETGKQAGQLRGHQRLIRSSAFLASENSALLATGSSDGSVRIWDLLTRRQVNRIPIEPNVSPLVAWSPNGQRLAIKLRYGSTREPIRIWNVTQNKEENRFGSGGSGSALKFLPNGTTLADLTIQLTLFDVRNGTKLHYFKNMPYSGRSTSIAFSGDGHFFATGQRDPKQRRSADPRTVTLWDTQSKSLIARFRGHEGPVSALALSPHGNVLATGSWDGTVRLWDLVSGQEKVCWRGHRGGIVSLAFSADSQKLISGGSDTTVLIWKAGRFVEPPKQLKPLTPRRFDQYWDQLLSSDSAEAYEALWRLVASRRQTVVYLKDFLTTRPVEKKQIRNWIRQLDDNRYSVRERAALKLRGLGPNGSGLIQGALQETTSLEVQQRLKRILQSQSRSLIRERRAIQILEYIGTPGAHNVLRKLANETTSSLNNDAREAQIRLSKRLAALAK